MCTQSVQYVYLSMLCIFNIEYCIKFSDWLYRKHVWMLIQHEELSISLNAYQLVLCRNITSIIRSCRIILMELCNTIGVEWQWRLFLALPSSINHYHFQETKGKIENVRKIVKTWVNPAALNVRKTQSKNTI